MDSLFGFSEAWAYRSTVCAGTSRYRRKQTPSPQEHIPDGVATLIISPCANPRFRNWRSWQPEYYAAVADHAAEKHGTARCS